MDSSANAAAETDPSKSAADLAKGLDGKDADAGKAPENKADGADAKSAAETDAAKSDADLAKGLEGNDAEDIGKAPENKADGHVQGDLRDGRQIINLDDYGSDLLEMKQKDLVKFLKDYKDQCKDDSSPENSPPEKKKSKIVSLDEDDEDISDQVGTGVKTCEAPLPKVDPFIQELYDRARNQKGWVGVGGEGGLHFNHTQKDQFVEMLAKAPHLRHVPYNCPNNWSDFRKLMKDYGFKREALGKGGVKFTHSEFIENGKLYLIQRESHVANNAAYRVPKAAYAKEEVMVREKKIPSQVLVALSPLRADQEMLSAMFKFLFTKVLTLTRFGKRFPLLLGYAQTFEDLSAKCVDEIDTIMGIWIYYSTRANIKGNLLAKHYALVALLLDFIEKAVDGQLDDDIELDDDAQLYVTMIVLQYSDLLTRMKRLADGLYEAIVRLKGWHWSRGHVDRLILGVVKGDNAEAKE